jgi:pimeloyl-ACP methyl ester carboxylesterase
MTTLESTATDQQGIVKKLYQTFFSPGKYEVKSSDREILEWGSNYRLPYDSGELAVTIWGSNGPAILLMHGWGGARAQMTGFVDPLLFAGYRVVAYDQPAHGDSTGTMTNLLEIAPSMDLIARREGNFYAVIAHSFGSLITSYALVKGNFPPPERLVYFGAFNQLLESLPRFQVLAGVADHVMDGLRHMIYENFGKEVLDAIVNEKLAPRIHIPAMMFHDIADNVTPVEDSRAIARVWKGAQLIETEGLGHRGALQSKSIHEQVVKFLRS